MNQKLSELQNPEESEDQLYVPAYYNTSDLYFSGSA